MSRAAPSTHNSRSMCHKCSEFISASADMAGLAAGTIRSRMDPKRTSITSSIMHRSVGFRVVWLLLKPRNCQVSARDHR
jgi:hypothetical protein